MLDPQVVYPAESPVMGECRQSKRLGNGETAALDDEIVEIEEMLAASHLECGGEIGLT